MSLLPFPSFLDDVQEKGWRKAIMEGIDETVTRITAGMNIQDIREALRGEDASRRPNPRLSPHADGFWLHMRPGYFHKDATGTYPTFRLGWLSVYFVFFETITGALLMLWYTPSPEIAYGNMLDILDNVPLGQYMRDLHRLGAEGMVLIVALHMMRTWITGSFKKPRQFTWFTGVILLVVTGILSFSGYLLPWDQLSLWAVTIGASMAEATPVIGAEVNLLLRGAPELGANGLLRFYLLHVIALPIVLFIFTGVHYYKVIIHGHSLPPQKENIGEDTAKRVPLDKRVYFIPDVLTNELVWIGVTTFILTVLTIWFYHAPLENHADPQITPLGTTAPWYFLWIQGALKLGDKLFWGIIFPTILLGVLAVMPYIDVGPSRRYAQRRVSLTLAMLLISFTTVLSYMGLPEFAVATSREIEILHELTFEPAHAKIGPARAVPYDQLIPGAYTTAQFEGDNPQLAISEYNEFLHGEPLAFVVDDNGNGKFVNGYDLLSETLVHTDHLNQAYMPETLSVVPDNAPDLEHVLEELHDLLARESEELPGATGVIIISENQPNGDHPLRRMDLAILWDGVVLSGGQVVLEDGETIPLNYTARVGEEFVDILFAADADGNIILDSNGVPQVVNEGEVENAVTVRQFRIQTDHIYINEDSAYFD